MPGWSLTGSGYSIVVVSGGLIPGMAAMVSWLEEIERRAIAARERIEELRSRIAELSESLAGQEAALSRLEITQETMTEILSGEGVFVEPVWLRCPAVDHDRRQRTVSGWARRSG